MSFSFRGPSYGNRPTEQPVIQKSLMETLWKLWRRKMAARNVYGQILRTQGLRMRVTQRPVRVISPLHLKLYDSYNHNQNIEG